MSNTVTNQTATQLSARSRSSDIFGFARDDSAASAVDEDNNVASLPAAQPLELEHVIGFSPFRNNLQYYPKLIGPEKKQYIVYAVNAMVVIQDSADPHDQEFLRGHDDQITALNVSAGGNFIASGQRASRTYAGGDAPVIVWSFEQKSDVFQLAGIKGRIND